MTNAIQTVAAQAQEVTAEAIVQVSNEISSLDINDKKLSVKQIAEKLNEIIASLNTLQNINSRVTRDRGPKSEKDMTEDDARKVMLGELKDASHKSAAETLGLSYGQVYSARKGFTFKSIYKEMKAKEVAPK